MTDEPEAGWPVAERAAAEPAGPGPDQALSGRRVLVVEDEVLVAEDILEELRAAGGTVIGPASDLSGALDLLWDEDPPDAAVLDLKLHDEWVYLVADALLAGEVPFLFATGHADGGLPPRFRHVPVCRKPLRSGEIAALLPQLLGTAR